MEFFKIKRDIPFIRHAPLFNIRSFPTFLAAVFFLFSPGPPQLLGRGPLSAT